MLEEKILIVEDNKALSKLLAKKMESNLIFNVDIAHSLNEAVEFIDAGNEYFLALLDLNLPDAPNGEVVDYMIEHKVPSIVLTGSMDQETRESILKKDIIDYVFKGNIDDVNYVFTLIDRLYKNRQTKVMIVDDSISTRSAIKKFLQRQMFQVFVAAHGEEALSFLNSNPDIKLILTDFNMPVIDGLELTKEVRKKYSKNRLSVIAMTSSNAELISAKFLKNGANDFINKPFTQEELICRLNNSIESIEYIETIEKMANSDFLTNLPNRRFFLRETLAYFSNAKKRKESFAVAMIDIDKFKNINDTFGHDAGDKVICAVADILRKNTKGSDLIARFGGEEFCVVLKDIGQNDAMEFFVKLRAKIASEKIVLRDKNEVLFTVSIGISFDEQSKTVEDAIRKADDALYAAKENGRNRVEIAFQ
ncbi:MAG: diguanylate cyclase [Sulfurospirillaceae bacterium]|nr:diguanylate cyclase [Sulfurospirillaceae bacterium]